MKDKYERAVEVIYRMKDNVAAGLPEMHGILYFDKPALVTSFEEMGPVIGYTLSPRTHIVNTFEVPAPESEPLDYAEGYYYPNHGLSDKYQLCAWTNHTCDHNRLKNNQVFLTKEAAILNQKAQAGIDPYGDES